MSPTFESDGNVVASTVRKTVGSLKRAKSAVPKGFQVALLLCIVAVVVIFNSHCRSCWGPSFEDWAKSHGPRLLEDTKVLAAGGTRLSPVKVNGNTYAPDVELTFMPTTHVNPIYEELVKGDAPVDLVYTWMNTTDPEYYKKKWETMDLEGSPSSGDKDSNFGELFYSLRSVNSNLPWINHIYIVTPDQVPSWLDVDHPKISVVFQNSLYPGEFKHHAPVFSSTAVEAHIHRIPGLSEHYLYMNDDFFIRHPRDVNFFFSGKSGRRIVPEHISQNPPPGSAYSTVFPMCRANCTRTMLGDSFCDAACDVEACGFDNGDCGAGGFSIPRPASYNSSITAEEVTAGMRLDRRNNYEKTMFLSNALLDHEFGWERRNAISHFPFLLTKSVMQELWELWPEAMSSTSAARTRCGFGETHPAYLHMHLIRSKNVPDTFENIWNKELDTNGDGWLDMCEVEEFMQVMHGAERWGRERSTIQDWSANNLMFELEKMEGYAKRFMDESSDPNAPSTEDTVWVNSPPVLVNTCQERRVHTVIARHTPVLVQFVRTVAKSRKMHPSFSGANKRGSWAPIPPEIFDLRRNLIEVITYDPPTWNNNNNVDGTASTEHIATMRAFFEQQLPMAAPWEKVSSPATLPDEAVKLIESGTVTLTRKPWYMTLFEPPYFPVEEQD